jgi:hypothetical protein
LDAKKARGERKDSKKSKKSKGSHFQALTAPQAHFDFREGPLRGREPRRLSLL